MSAIYFVYISVIGYPNMIGLFSIGVFVVALSEFVWGYCLFIMLISVMSMSNFVIISISAILICLIYLYFVIDNLLEIVLG